MFFFALSITEVLGSISILNIGITYLVAILLNYTVACAPRGSEFGTKKSRR
jgi:hypothetical protein